LRQLFRRYRLFFSIESINPIGLFSQAEQASGVIAISQPFQYPARILNNQRCDEEL
jgi:hypothetical protein